MAPTLATVLRSRIALAFIVGAATGALATYVVMTVREPSGFEECVLEGIRGAPNNNRAVGAVERMCKSLFP